MTKSFIAQLLAYFLYRLQAFRERSFDFYGGGGGGDFLKKVVRTGLCKKKIPGPITRRRKKARTRNNEAEKER